MLCPELRGGGLVQASRVFVERYAKGRTGERRINDDGKPSIYCLTWTLTLPTVTCDCAALVVDQISSHALFDSNVSKSKV